MDTTGLVFDFTKPIGRRCPDPEWYKTLPEDFDSYLPARRKEWRRGNLEYRQRHQRRKFREEFDAAYQAQQAQPASTSDPFAGL
ncbi:MAG: hypothetical protein WC211_03725 [Dehalococcoidia bacterium]